LTGNAEKLDAFLVAMNESTVLEVVRSGILGLSRGEKILAL
jgi:acetolactate synthase-1/3 small subunit